MLEEASQGVPPQEKEGIKVVSIPSTDVVDGVAFYIINVTGNFNKWSVNKRYSQFEELQQTLTSGRMADDIPAGCSLPPKRIKLFTSHVSKGFLEERRVLLESYLRKLVSVESLASSGTLMEFLTSDKRGDEQVAEIASPEEELPNDVEITGASIPATRTMSDHVLYQIDVTNAHIRKTYSKWTILKRFGQFYEMDCAVRIDFAEDPETLEAMPAPPKRQAKLFNDHMGEEFVEQRRVLLENYLNGMLRVLKVVRNKNFLIFMGVSQ